LGALSTTHSKAIHKVDIPAFNWPTTKFPALKYPLEKHEKENREEEEACLKQVRERILASREPNSPWGDVAAVVIEPVQAEGGDRHATPFFFNGLRKITKELGVVFIVDEVQTGGGGTGKFWAHEHWNLTECPDIVCFSKKLQAAGFYYKKELTPNMGYRIFNTWLGDPLRALQLRTILDVIESDKLLDNVNATGDYLLAGLRELESVYGQKELIKNVRGLASFGAFDSKNPQTRDAIINELRNRGVEAGGSGDATVRLRPALVFTPKHASIFLKLLNESIEAVSKQ
jgi:4-aminobutyrate aminotransferase/(S)-3-amino-2-methylpropionate transaminase